MCKLFLLRFNNMCICAIAYICKENLVDLQVSGEIYDFRPLVDSDKDNIENARVCLTLKALLYTKNPLFYRATYQLQLMGFHRKNT